jgi:tRNA A37 threonylcarbamoyladenosine dehydratase
MARPAVVRAERHYPVSVRIGKKETERLKTLLFCRYPRYEWATFARFGWRKTPTGLVLSLADLIEPHSGDIDERVGHVAIQESYTLRVALEAETHPLGVCVIHSHPKGGAPYPSNVDDDMDAYYAKYFGDFAPARPYLSLIFSEVDEHLVISGRMFWNGQWVVIDRFRVEQTPVETWIGGERPRSRGDVSGRLARMTAAFGREAGERLQASTVAVIGAGGTGSAAIATLARAGVGCIIVVDPDRIEESNLERLHGGTIEDVKKQRDKVVVARNHIREIDPSIKVVALVGSLPQKEIVDAILHADVVLGCTDQQHSRLALSDVALRFRLPALDCGVTLEGSEGVVSGQCLQLVRFLSADPCALCRDMISPLRIAQELMSTEERRSRQRAAEEARTRGEDPDPYWKEQPQLNTVGYLTTTAGALIAGYAIGWLTGRFGTPFSRLQVNLVAPFWDVTDFHPAAREECACNHVRGWADQGSAEALISAPDHWKPVINVTVDQPQ